MFIEREEIKSIKNSGNPTTTNTVSPLNYGLSFK